MAGYLDREVLLTGIGVRGAGVEDSSRNGFEGEVEDGARRR
jgi:hypothetical protein